MCAPGLRAGRGRCPTKLLEMGGHRLELTRTPAGSLKWTECTFTLARLEAAPAAERLAKLAVGRCDLVRHSDRDAAG